MIEFPYPGPNVLQWMSETKDALDERFKFGSGSPQNVVTANIGCQYVNTDGGASTTLWVKESGTGTNTGWVAK